MHHNYFVVTMVIFTATRFLHRLTAPVLVTMVGFTQVALPMQFRRCGMTTEVKYDTKIVMLFILRVQAPLTI